MRFAPPEALFIVGAIVRPRDPNDDAVNHGKISHAKTVQDDAGRQTMLYGVRALFTSGVADSKEPRQIVWYRYDELEYVNPPIAGKTPLSYEQRTISDVWLGELQISTWYYSPFPAPYTQVNELFICPFCMRYMRKRKTYAAHSQSCDMAHPPGLKIYDDGLLAAYEVDGRLNKLFCQCLCLFAKLFLDSKTLFYDTDIFLFYIMTVRTSVLDDELNATLGLTGSERIRSYSYSTGETIVGYFSKEKTEWNILACILTFPCYQRMGIGTLLIDFAYLLGQVENRQAGPEEPLSRLGAFGFHSYWSMKVLEYLLRHVFGANLEELLRAEREKGAQSPGTCSVHGGPDTIGDLSSTTVTDTDERDDRQSASIISSRTPVSDSKASKRVEAKRSEHIDLAHICEQTGLLKKHVMEGLHRLPYIRFRSTDFIDVTSSNLDNLLKYYLKREGSKTGRLLCHKLRQECLHWDAYTTMYRRRDRIV